MRSAALALALTLAAPAALADEVTRVPERAPADAKARALWGRLDSTRCSVEFSDTPLVQALRWIREHTRCNVVLDPAAQEDIYLADLRVDLELTDVPLRAVLHWTLDAVDCVARWRHGVLWVTTAELDRRAAPRELRRYDVRDLTHRVAWMGGPGIALHPGAQRRPTCDWIFR